VFKARFYELCDRFKNFYHIYTDGFKIGRRVSAALCHKRGVSSIRLPGATSIFNAELHAILLALDVVRKSKEKHFLLLSNSYSSLIALGGSHVDHGTIYKYLKTYSTLTNCGKTVILCWIPGHVGIPGNERADRVAKAALSLPLSPVKVSAMNFLPRAKLLTTYTQRMARNMELCDGNAINPTVGVTKLNGSLGRKDAVIINRLQIGHTHATHAHLLGDGDDEAFCTTCYTSLTVTHSRVMSTVYHLRQQYHFGSTLKDLFNNTSVNDIIAFIKDTYFYTRIYNRCCISFILAISLGFNNLFLLEY